MSKTKILVVLPAYNEEKSLARLLNRLDFVYEEFNLNLEVLVINDGSTDSTLEVVQNYKSQYKLYIKNIQPNAGLANAIKEGFGTALSMVTENDIIIVMDADDSHTPGLILQMTRLIHEGADVVIASRYQKGSRIKGLTRFRRFLSWGASILFRIMIGVEGVRDYTCGYRAYKASLLKTALTDYREEFIQQSGFAAMSEVLLKLSKFEPIILEVPFILRYDLKESASKINICCTIRQTISMVFKYRFHIK
jgi:dolichol-phosphate mannosyltransferase